jgi:putative transcriptional regulator
MLSDVEDQLYQEVANIFIQSQYDLSTPLLGAGGCFDLVAKKDAFLLLIKLLENIDSFRGEQAYELQKLASMVTAAPLIIGHKIRNDAEIEDGIVYSRYDIPAISIRTLQSLLLHHLPPLIFTHRGGFRVKINGERLKEKRLEKNLSRGDLAIAVGISKRTIYEYERGTIDVSVETAFQIEEFLDEPLTLAINLFDSPEKIGSLNKAPENRQTGPEGEVERKLKEHFDEHGMTEQLWAQKIPFRVIAKNPTPRREKHISSTITSIAQEQAENNISQRVKVTCNISQMTHTRPLFVIDSSIDRSLLMGLPIMTIDELIKKKEKRKKEKQ